MRLIKAISILLFIFSFGANLFAQNLDDSLNLKGKYALQFQIVDFLKFSNFDGGTISTKYHITSLIAIRSSFNLSYNEENNDRTLENLWDSYSTTDYFLDEYELLQVGDQLEKTLGISIQVLLSSQILNDLYIYSGIGPFVEMTNFKKSEFARFRSSLGSQKIGMTNLKEERLTYGLNFNVGTEWFLLERLSLTLEQVLKIGSSEVKIEQVDEGGKHKRNINSKFFDGSKILFGLSIYF